MSADAVTRIPLTGLLVCALLVVATILLSRRERLGLERDLIVGALRTLIQLVAVGYVLAAIFGLDRPLVVLGVLAVMLGVAARTASRRVPTMGGLFPPTLLALTGSSIAVLLFVTELVLRVPRWYEPRVLIPLAGMIIGNAMNGASLAAERLAAEVGTRRGEIEALLALGATSARASREAVRGALRAALIPTVNGLMTVGIVHLPGVMTGQILAGASPLQAVRLQVVIMYMLTATVAFASLGIVLLARRRLFTSDHQLR
jgi:putative ABC transport system permease protein